ncbi:transposase [Sediminicoccus sp. BL-A-41-H5]|uniref:transposase n=1 Tax=Sediminicoccus sp. BL-A-41-H5 TaxID=3421106 RepID=UPI003D678782
MRTHLTDAEYALLLPLIPGGGRPSEDRRRTLDGIFHVVMSRCIWAEMPARFGKPDTVRRQLVRWMQAGVLDRWLFAATNPEFDSLRERLCRAWRRVARRATLHQLLVVKELDLRSALPCAPCFLPDLALSESIEKLVAKALEDLRSIPRGLLKACGGLLKMAGGDMRQWRTR